MIEQKLPVRQANFLIRAQLKTGLALLFCLVLFAFSSSSQADPGYDTIWESVYPLSSSEDNSTPCKLCHTTNSGGAQWNAYGWAIRQAVGTLDNRIQNVQNLNSDGDPSNSSNLAEISANTQPGWTAGAFNSVYGASGLISSTATAPPGIMGNLDIPSTFTVGGVISGLTGSVTLQNNSGDNLTRNTNGSFTFPTALVNGSNYAVSVLTHPVGQTCSVSAGSGSIASANVTNVGVNCADIPATAWPVSPMSIEDPEGTVIQIYYTVQETDWVEPNDYWLGRCADSGTTGAKWVFVFHLEPQSDTAIFDQTEPPSADLHLLAGDNNDVIGSSAWFYCSAQTTPPTLTGNQYFKISLLNDDLVEQTEYAYLDLYLEDSSFNKIYHGSIFIEVQDASDPNTNVCSSFSLDCNGVKHRGSITVADCDDSPRGDGYLAEIRSFEGVQGEPVVIHADWDMDGYLFLEAPDGSLLSNDDYTDIYDSHIETVLGQTGTYKIWATTYTWATSGLYEISVSCPSRPVDDLIFQTSFESLVVNKPPIADAGTDQVVYGGGSFPATLIGERSLDPDGQILTATWTQLSGPTAPLGARSGFNQNYDLLNLDTEAELVFELSVQDNGGAVDTDTVTITVIPGQINFRLETIGSLGATGAPSLLLFRPDGSILDSRTGFTIDMDFPAGSGVIYAVATATQPLNMVLTAMTPDGQVLSSTISESDSRFLTPDDLADDPARYLVFAQTDSVNSFPQLPQILEVALSHPDPGLRDPDRFLSFLNQASRRFQEDDASAEAYYRAVDPDNSRTSFDDWLQVTGFKDNGPDAHALYQNDADLGFGRDMYMRQNPDGTIASYVRNFPSLEHAVANESLIATVAMEFSPTPGHPENYTKFFVFGPDGERLTAVDLDGRGAKPVPGVCNVCHGGTPKVTFEDNTGALPVLTYPDQGDTNAQFLPWDLDTFIYSTKPGLTRADQEYQFYHLNQLAKATYPSDPDAITGNRWTGAAATELVNGWYGGGQLFEGSFVPPGWKHNDDPDENLRREKLYREVVGPNCRACHITRGTFMQNAIDFSTYDKFMDYAPVIRELVYNQGVMPLAVRTFGHFWNGKKDSPAAQLAEALKALSADFDLILVDGDTQKPGRPIARTGLAYWEPQKWVTLDDDPQGTILDGRDSLFATNQDWRVVSETFTPEEVLAFGNYAVTEPAPGDEDTEYRLARQIAPPAAVKHTLFVRGPINISFSDIDGYLKSNCSGCHSGSEAGVPNIPVYFDLEGDEQYKLVLDLINFAQPTQSPLLTKPGGLAHGANSSSSVGWEPFTPSFRYFGPNGEVLHPADYGSIARDISQWLQIGAPK